MRVIKGSLFVGAVLSVLLYATPATAGTYTGRWSGPTSQDKGITFKVSDRDRVTFLKLGWTAKGTCTVEGTTTIRDLSVKIRDGRFRVETSANPYVIVRGEFVALRRAEGHLHVDYSDPFCDATGRGTWKARKQ